MRLFHDRGRDEAWAFEIPLPPGKESECQKDQRLALMAVKNGCTTNRSIGLYIGPSNNNPVRVITALQALQRKGKVQRTEEGWVLA